MKRDCTIEEVNNTLTSNQVRRRYNLEEVGISLSKSTIKRRLLDCKYSGFTLRCKPLVTLKYKKSGLGSKSTCQTDKTKITYNWMIGKEKKGLLSHAVKHGGRNVMACTVWLPMKVAVHWWLSKVTWWKFKCVLT